MHPSSHRFAQPDYGFGHARTKRERIAERVRSSMRGLVHEEQGGQTVNQDLRGIGLAMDSDQAISDGHVLRPRGPVALFAGLWIYGFAFGFLALAVFRIAELLIDVPRFRTVAQLAAIITAAIAGIYLYVPTLRVAQRLLRISSKN